MSQDEVPETTFVALTPRSARGNRPQASAAPHALPQAPSAPTPSSPPPTRRDVRPTNVGSGGFSGYQVNDATTKLRRQGNSTLVWGAAGVGLGIVLLAGVALLLTQLT